MKTFNDLKKFEISKAQQATINAGGYRCSRTTFVGMEDGAAVYEVVNFSTDSSAVASSWAAAWQSAGSTVTCFTTGFDGGGSGGGHQI